MNILSALKNYVGFFFILDKREKLEISTGQQAPYCFFAIRHTELKDALGL